MNASLPLHLWTFQAMEACEVLEKNGTLQVDWQITPVNWRPAYRWMAQEMETQGVVLQGFAPVWAWHSCGGAWGGRPTFDTARALLTDMQLADGICVVELDAPAEICLLSSYSRFCELLDKILDNETPEREAFLDMFDVPPIIADDDVQAALPYLKKEWVSDIRHLDMKPDRWDYDWKKAV